MYINVRELTQFLGEYNSSQDYYLGHWPQWPVPHHGNFRTHNYPEAKKETYYYASGTTYCISASVLPKMEKYVRHNGLVKICSVFNLVEDEAVGAVVG